jgi:DNA mismatch endonuclease (patch repair protein)
VFLHGCFWHCHGRCKIARIPRSRLSYWIPKLRGNKRRDVRNRAKLRYRKWKVLTVWECQLADLPCVRKRIKSFLRAN